MCFSTISSDSFQTPNSSTRPGPINTPPSNHHSPEPPKYTPTSPCNSITNRNRFYNVVTSTPYHSHLTSLDMSSIQGENQCRPFIFEESSVVEANEESSHPTELSCSVQNPSPSMDCSEENMNFTGFSWPTYSLDDPQKIHLRLIGKP